MAAKGNPAESVSFLQKTNPEVFRARPRPGGALRLAAKEVSSLDKLEIPEKISREFRVQTALEEVTSVNSQEPTLPNPLKDAMHMVSISLSTIAMMAANYATIPDEYYDWTANFLDCIKDENGKHPPNIQSILNHIEYIKSGNAPAAQDTTPPPAEDQEGGEQTVRSVTRVRMGSQDAGEAAEPAEEAEAAEPEA